MLTTKVRLRKVEAVINPLAGSVGPSALAEMQALLADHGLTAQVRASEPHDLAKTLQLALDHSPDLLIVLAGDGTARAACEMAGEQGPLVAPLPGGTMNLLPKALYGARDWKTALVDSLTEGVARDVSGGEINGRRFFVGAMLGWPALWARAREAAREGQLHLAWRRTQSAWRRAFTGHVHFALDGHSAEKADAVSLMCPLVSRGMQVETAIEVAALNPAGLKDALRVGIRALVGDALGDWRDDPAVDMGSCRQARVWTRGELPAWMDGEPTKLPNQVSISFHPKAFRALAPGEDTPAAEAEG